MKRPSASDSVPEPLPRTGRRPARVGRLLVPVGIAPLLALAVAAAARSPRIWPGGDGTFIIGDEVRVGYLFRLNDPEPEPRAEPGDRIRIQALFPDTPIDYESFFAGAPIAAENLHPRPGDDIQIHLGYEPRPRPPDSPAGRADAIAIDFDLQPETIDAARVAEILRRARTPRGDADSASASTTEGDDAETSESLPAVDRIPFAPGDEVLLHLDWFPRARPPEHRLLAAEEVSVRFESYPSRVDAARLAAATRSPGVASLRDLPLAPGDELMLHLDYDPRPRPPDHRLLPNELANVSFDLYPEKVDAALLGTLARGAESDAAVDRTDPPTASPAAEALRAGDRVLLYADYSPRPRPADHRATETDRIRVDFEIVPDEPDAASLAEILRDGADSSVRFANPEESATGAEDAPTTTTAFAGYRTDELDRLPLAPGDSMLLFVDYVPEPRLPDHRVGPNETVSVQFVFNPKYDFRKRPAPDGTMEAPLIGRFAALGKTAAEIAAELRPQYESLLGTEIVRVEVVSSEERYRTILSQMRGASEAESEPTGGAFPLKVRPDGRVYVPGLGFLPAEGRSAAAVRDAVVAGFAESGFVDFVVDATFAERGRARLDPATFADADTLPDEEGDVRVPLLGAIRATGRTAGEIRDELMARYAALVGPVRLDVRFESDRGRHEALLEQWRGASSDEEGRTEGSVFAFSVRPDGTLRVPGVGVVAADGREPGDVEAEIRAALRREGFTDLDPTIGISRRSPFALSDGVFGTFAGRPDQDGAIRAPLLGRVAVAGLTAAEIRDRLEGLYKPLVGQVRLFASIKPNEEDYAAVVARLRGAAPTPETTPSGVFPIRVRPDGTVFVPGAGEQGGGNVELAGRTLGEAETALAAAFEAAGLGDFDVALSFSEAGGAALGPETFASFASRPDDDGTIRAPLLGRVAVLGKTAEEIRRDLEARYASVAGEVGLEVRIAASSSYHDALFESLAGAAEGAAASRHATYPLRVRPDGRVFLPSIGYAQAAGADARELTERFSELLREKGYADVVAAATFGDVSSLTLGPNAFRPMQSRPDAEGFVELPLAGRVKVLGRGAAEIQAELAARYAALVGDVGVRVRVVPWEEGYTALLARLGTGTGGGVVSIGVGGDGTAAIPELGRVRATTLTAGELERTIREGFAAAGYVDLTVDVSLRRTSKLVLERAQLAEPRLVEADGRIALPVGAAPDVRGMTGAQVTEAIREAYRPFVPEMRIDARVDRAEERRYEDLRAALTGSGFTTTVAADGKVRLPGVGAIPFAGRTPDEATAAVEEAYRTAGYDRVFATLSPPDPTPMSLPSEGNAR